MPVLKQSQFNCIIYFLSPWGATTRLLRCSAKTPLANFATGITILVTLLWITPVFTNMSQNVQGAIIIVGVLQLFDW